MGVDSGLVAELGLACPPDNRSVTPGGWRTVMNNRHDVEWTPPPGLDTGQTRINTHHRPEVLLRPPDDEQPAEQTTVEPAEPTDPEPATSTSDPAEPGGPAPPGDQAA
ncbi:hypothetical protein EU78_00405 [Mycolicibacterium rufum]|nr:hypothetical protein EU78_00405 [Mycolicibacterium rufum]